MSQGFQSQACSCLDTKYCVDGQCEFNEYCRIKGKRMDNSEKSEGSNPYELFEWAVHTIGPDDIEPCVNFQEAVIKAANINAVAIEVIEGGKITANHPVLHAQIVREAKVTRNVIISTENAGRRLVQVEMAIDSYRHIKETPPVTLLADREQLIKAIEAATDGA